MYQAKRESIKRQATQEANTKQSIVFVYSLIVFSSLALCIAPFISK